MEEKMSFIRHKKFGQKTYAYEVTSYWDAELKKPRQKSIYLGMVGEADGKPTKRVKVQPEQSIVDFGDGYALFEMARVSGLSEVIMSSFEDAQSILALMSYQLLDGHAMCHAEEWASGNMTSRLYPGAKLGSQEVSRLLKYLGQESTQRVFFKHYVARFFQGKKGLLIDSTALASAINTSLNAWGYGAEGICEHVNCVMLVDKESKLPIYFRAVSGDIPDVSVLGNTLDEIARLGIEADQAILDAGFYSEKNIKLLCERNINFITRLPKSRTLFKTLTDQIGDIETRKYACMYGERALFIKEETISVCDTLMYAYIVLDPDKKAKDTRLLLKEALEKPDHDADVDLQIKKGGLFILISKTQIPLQEVLPAYYTRQNIEQVFGFAKSNNNLLPLRVHSRDAINGYLLLVFMTLSLFIMLRQKLQPKLTMDAALISLRNLKAKIYDKEIIPQELNKKSKTIFDQLEIMVPKMLGV